MTTVTVIVGDRGSQARGCRQHVTIALTVLFAAWVMGWLWWLVAAAAVLGTVVVGARWCEQRQRRLAAIAARADQQHAWVLEGDPRGTYGGQ